MTARLAHTAALLALAALGVEAAGLRPQQLGPGALHARQAPAAGATNNTDDPLSIQSYMATGYTNGAVAPGTWPTDASGQSVVVDPSDDGVSDNSQVSWCPTIFIGGANVNGSWQTGWTQLPELVGFDLRRDLVVDRATNAVLPYYAERKDFTKIKRVIVIQPGQPRDSWKYTNLVRNALLCAASNSSLGVSLQDVLVVGPAWLSLQDHNAGAAQANDLYFPSGGAWSEGVRAVGPGDTKVSSMKAMDTLVTSFFDKSAFPQLGSVIVAGHSLGGSFTQRYAMLRSTNETEDPYVQYWTGNCGAYAWPSSDHPVAAASACSSSYDKWPYGLSAGIPAYANSSFDRTATVNTYLNRTIHYFAGALDDGPGDTSCAAQTEGGTHLERATNLQAALNKTSQAAHPAWTYNLIGNTSHQDYRMLASTPSLQRLFSDGLNATISASANGGSSSSASASPSATSSGHKKHGGDKTSSAAGASSSSQPSQHSSGAPTRAVHNVLLAPAVAVLISLVTVGGALL